MCEQCGCKKYIEKGPEAVIQRAKEVIREFQITPENADDYEATETISRLIAPFGAPEDEIFRTAAWVSGLHMDVSRAGREKQYQAHVRAFEDIFRRLPVQGNPKDIATTWHQLEQLGHALDQSAMVSLDPRTRKTMEAVNHVHDGNEAKTAKLKERYGL